MVMVMVTVMVMVNFVFIVMVMVMITDLFLLYLQRSSELYDGIRVSRGNLSGPNSLLYNQ